MGKFSHNRLNRHDKAVFIRQLATLITAGIPIDIGCTILRDSQKNHALSTLIRTILSDIKQGKSLYHATSKHTRFFDEITRQLIRIGELTGKLDTTLTITANHLERQIEITKRFQQALFYPCFIALISFLICLFLILFVVPQFAELFQEAGANDQLHWITRLIFKISSLIRNDYYFIILVPILIRLLMIFQSKTSSKKSLPWHQRLPILRDYFSKQTQAKLARQLALMFASGIPIPDALRMSAPLSMHSIWRHQILAISRQVNAGRPLAEAISHLTHASPLFVQFIRMGEESGKLDAMLDKFAEILEAESDQLINKIGKLLEPLIMVVLGVLIGGLVMGMYLPLFNLGSIL